MRKKVQKFPTLQVLLDARRQSLEEFIRKNYIDSEERLNKICRLIRVEPPAWSDVQDYLKALESSFKKEDETIPLSIEKQVDVIEVAHNQEPSSIAEPAVLESSSDVAEAAASGDDFAEVDDASETEDENSTGDSTSKTVKLIQNRRLEKRRKGK